MLFGREPFTSLLVAAGFREIIEYGAQPPEEYDSLNGAMPPELRAPWSDEKYNWADPKTGLSMWAMLRNAVENHPGLFIEWRGMLEEVDDMPEISDRSFRRAAERGARWISSPV